jgi:putative endonuclease
MERDTEAIWAVNCPEPVEGTFFVSILLCRDDSFYIGSTKDVANRLKEHRAGEASSWTKKRLPIILVNYESYAFHLHARKREKQLKGWTRAKKLKLIRGEWKKIENV